MELRFSLTIDNGVEDTITPIMTALATRAVGGFTEAQDCCIEKLMALGGAFNELLPVDLFKDESVELNRQLKDLQDLSTVWTDYTQNFQIPASETNNIIFADWFDENIVLGAWNPNLGKDATLYIHSIPVYQGRVEFIGCKFKDGIPQLYNIVFYGTTKKILDIWGQKVLNSISWSDYDHVVNYTNILASWDGALLGGDILWPIADYNQGWRYSTSSGVNGNIRDPKGVEVDDLRPTIRLRAMLTNVFKSAGYTLNGSFLTRPEMTDLYVLPMQTAGPLYDPQYVGTGIASARIEPFTYTQSTLATLNYTRLIYPTIVTNASGNYNNGTGIYTANRKGNYTFQFGVYVLFNIPVTGQSITFVVMVNGRVMKSQSFTTNVGTFPLPAYVNFNQSLNSGDQVSFSYKTFNSNVTAGSPMYFDCTIAPQGINGNVVSMKDAMPKMAIKDFVNGVLKTFNCILIPTSDKTIEIHNLNDWYKLGVTKNWSPFIDTKDIEHDKIPIPKTISFKHKENGMLASDYYRMVNTRDYGSIEFTPLIDYPTENFMVESPFCVIVPQQMYQVNANGQKVRLTNLQIPVFMDQDSNSLQLDLTLFYYGGKLSISDPYYFNNNGVPVNQYVLPLMTSYADFPTTNATYSVAFGLETTISGDAPTATMWDMYWSDYLSRMYSSQSRLVKLSAYIPVGEWLNFKLNDTIAISGNYYKVQSVKYDMLTELANLELITYPDVEIMRFATTGQRPVFTEVTANGQGKTYIRDYVVANGIMNAYTYGDTNFLDTNQDIIYNQNNVFTLVQEVSNLQAIVQFNQITMYRDNPINSTTEGTTWIPVPQEHQESIGYTQNITNDLTTAKYICTDGGQYKFTAMVEVSQSGNQHITFAIMVNGIKTTGFGGMGNDYGVVYLSTILDLAPTDQVQLMWKFFSGGSHNITIVSSNFLVLKK